MLERCDLRDSIGDLLRFDAEFRMCLFALDEKVGDDDLLFGSGRQFDAVGLGDRVGCGHRHAVAGSLGIVAGEVADRRAIRQAELLADGFKRGLAFGGFEVICGHLDALRPLSILGFLQNLRITLSPFMVRHPQILYVANA